MLKILLMGASGFIGKHLISTFSNREDLLLTIFGRTYENPDIKNVRFINGNYEDSRDLMKALKGQDLIYHFISQTIPSSSWDNPLAEIEKNLIPFLTFIRLAAENGIKKICFASSGGTVYGLQSNLLTEESLTEPFSPYGITKRTLESFLQYTKLRYQINYDIYRISNVYGIGQNTGKGLGFINTVLENILSNRPVIIFGDGESVRDYINVRDVAKLMTLSTFKDIDNSDIYNVSSGEAVSLNELVNLIKNVVKINFEIKYTHNRLSDNQRVILDNSKIMQYFKESSLIPLDQGIDETYNYLKYKI